MTKQVPMFPLNTVLFPGVSVPLRVFEDRYRALVHHLLRIEDPAERVFGSVAIREGFEVGERGGQSVHRVGCLLQLTDAEAQSDGTFEIVAVGRQRLRLSAMDASGPYLEGTVEEVADDDHALVSLDVTEEARQTFAAYRVAVSRLHGESVLEGDLPQDPTYLSWSIAATGLFTMPDQQRLLETDDTTERLARVTQLMRQELRTMEALPSLPATRLARTGWSPN